MPSGEFLQQNLSRCWIQIAGKQKRTQKDDSNTDRRTEYVSLVMFFGTARPALVYFSRAGQASLEALKDNRRILIVCRWRRVYSSQGEGSAL